ncbi:zonular occludens toxin domain-containing protein [Aquirhabdus parva]|uniref:Zonular occludens toxin n=1 Tax=Aquirhabdus parva TaxID=2283318 RepID=A0A345P702_9GAMM|nr:zonular occludens toxin domain-containing protein [Aquirhabdus parva]AXI03061.1 zonular occludens toxin [Aquirhabdus parva]
MALTLVTGVPRSGKSLFTVKKIIDLIGEGRTVYSDIEGLNIIGLQPAPDDYRTTPHGSVIVYDEVQKRNIWSRKFRGLNDIIESLQTHGHYGYDIIIITQHPKFLNTDVTAVVGEHYHVARAMNAQMSNIWLWRNAQDNPHTKSAKREAENVFLFPYPKHLFALYKSAHNHSLKKLAIPMKVINAVWMLVVVIIMIAYLYHKAFATSSTPPVAKTQAEIAKGSIVANPVKAPDSQVKQEVKDDKSDLQAIENKRVAFVIYNGGGCVAKNSYGEILPIDMLTCKQYSDHPSMLSFSRMPQPDQPWRHESQQPVVTTKTL